MISYHKGNLFESGADALVNTVNTVGVMGKGLALQFKKRYPKNFELYAEACRRGEVQTGKLFVTQEGDLLGSVWIINFPTKQHWKHPSRLEWVESGLADLRRVIEEHAIKSIAIPPLGCGLGGLDWPTVKALIEEALNDIVSVDVMVYEP